MSDRRTVNSSWDDLDAINETPDDIDLDGDDIDTTYPITNREYAGGDNEYQITVSATEMSNALPRKRTDSHLTIQVTNVGEDGTISFDGVQPEVGTAWTATLADPDAVLVDETTTWTWYVSKVADPDLHTPEHWNEVPDAADAVGTAVSTAEEESSPFTPRGVEISDTNPNTTVIDEGRHLRVKAVYTDQAGSDTTYAMTESAVRAEVSSQNDGVNAPWDNGSPDFVKLSEEITVAEDLAVGANVGSAFQAVEPDPEDVLYYSIVAAADDDTTTDS